MFCLASSSSSSSSYSRAVLLICVVASLFLAANAGNFYQDVEVYFGGDRAKIFEAGQLLTLSLDNVSGSGFRSKNEYLFGRFDMRMQLVPGNSAGTVTTFYLTSLGDAHDEIDFEFLGNSSGQPYTLHTNVFAQGKGGREQRFKMWYDPSKDFHTYTIIWNSERIIFLVDESPIRVFYNNESSGVAFPTKQPMRIYCSLWNADDWATQGGRVKTDWSNAPFGVSYRDYSANGCVSSGSSTCKYGSNEQAWKNVGLDDKAQNNMRLIRQNSIIYNYCTDSARFPQGYPPECKNQ